MLNRRTYRFFSMALVITLLTGLFSIVPAMAQAPVVYLNEMEVSTTSTDWEFFELQGTPGTDLSALTLIGIESDNYYAAGTIDTVISLAGQSIPADGFFVGMSPAGASEYGVTGDMEISNNSFENSTATYILVEGFTGAKSDDVDTDNDGVLDVMPWTAIIDGLNIRDAGATDFDYGFTSVGPDGSYLPAGTYRCPNAPFGTFGSTNILNFSSSDGTPGYSNASTCGLPDVFINEMEVSTTSTDWEFFELQGTPGTDLSALTLIGIESDNYYAAGTIDTVISLAGQSIPADGFFVGMSPAGASEYGVTGDMEISNNSFENSTATYILVEGFTGAKSDDVDTDNDGVLDVMPWTAIIDGLNIRDAGATDFDYGFTSVGPDGSYLPAGTYRCPDAPTGGFGDNILNFSTPDGTPGTANCGETPPPVSYCGEAYTPIYEIQGNGATSPLENATVKVEGVVVGIFQDGFDGFFIQDAAGDSDMATSDGIFVYSDAAVSEGDLVRVDGTVKEFFDLTEIGNVSNVEVCSTGNSVDATVLTLPLASTDLEPYEGMLVTIPQTLYINEYFNFDRYGHIVLSSERLFQPSAIFDPESPDASQLLADNKLDMIKLDDGYGSQNPDPAYHPNGAIFDLSNLFRGGDTLNNVTGVVNYSFGEFMIEPTMGADYTSMNPRTAAPDAVGGGIKVASFNVLNYFTTLDDGVNDICGPAENMECRGADNTEEFERQRAKIIAALAAIDADVIGLIEIENNLTDVATADLVSGLNDMVGAGTYGYVATGAIGTDAIRQAFIYKTASVSMVGSYAVLDSADFMDPLGSGKDKNRPALAQTFMDNETGGIFTVVVNHLKSKGSACDGDYDPIAGNCDLTRTLAAEKLVDWLAGDPTGSNDGDFLIIGDLNSYDKEAPIDALIAGGFGDMVYQYLGENAYSYVFDSQLGYLDHALANADLAEELTGVTIWHINADEPDLIDYDTSYKKAAQDALYAPDPYRSSDHDPVIVGLDVCDEIAPVIHSLTATPDELWPANHKYVDIAVELVATDNFDQDLTIELISVTSSEEDEGLGDGDFPDDIVVLDTFNLQLRAERSGVNGEGRIYTLTYLVTDDCGNSATQSVTVFVPFSQSKN